MLQAGKLRHRVTVQARQNVQDPVTGETSVVWSNAFESVPAAIEPLSARDLIAAQAQQSSVSARVTMRPLPGLTAQHRLLHVCCGGGVLSIDGIVPDPGSGQEWLTLPVSEGMSDGE